MTRSLRPGVLFDVDGTLLDSNYLHVVAWAQAFHDTGHPDVPTRDIHRSIGLSSGLLTEHLLGAENQATVDAHADRFAALRHLVVATRGAGDLLRWCAGHGLVPVLATSGAAADLDWMLPAIGAGDAVGGAVTSADVEKSKPAPEMFAVAMDKHRLDPRATAVVGDTVWDVESAERAGLPCLAVTCGGISASELRDAGAGQVYDDPRQLLDRVDGSVLAGLADG